MIPVNIGCNFAKFGYQFLFSGIYPIFVLRKINLIMLIIDSKDCENIDKALKKYKKKFEKAKVLVQLRERQSFTKPSVKRRGEVLKAVYKQQVAAGKFEL
jgi:small subunit ribosomal protein S21